MNIELSDYKDISRLEVAEEQHENSKSGFYAALVFFIWPLLSVFLAFKDYRSTWAKNILWAFVAFYGMSFAIGTESQNSDIIRYVAEVEYLHGIQMSVDDAFDYYFQSGEVDILRTFIAVVVSRFTSNQLILTLIYGIIFGFFFSRNMWFVLEHLKGRIRGITILLFISFFLLIPIWYMNGFRMWTAAHIFIYGALPFLYHGKWRGVIIASLAVLVHYSFLLPVGVLYLYILCGNRLIIYFTFFIATFFIAEINLEVFNNIVESYAPQVIQERTSGYRGSDYVESFRESGGGAQVWYVVWYGKALKWAVWSFLVLLFVRGRDFFYQNRKWLNLFSFALLFCGVANLFSSLPSAARFVGVANMISLTLVILYVQNIEDESIIPKTYLLATPLLLLFIVVSLRKALYSMSATVIFGNPIISLLFNEEQLSLNDFLRMFI